MPGSFKSGAGIRGSHRWEQPVLGPEALVLGQSGATGRRRPFPQPQYSGCGAPSRLPAVGAGEHPDSCAYRLVPPGELISACPHLPCFRAALPGTAPDTNSTTVSDLEGTPSSVPNGVIVLIGKPGARWEEGRGQAEALALGSRLLFLARNGNYPRSCSVQFFVLFCFLCSSG